MDLNKASIIGRLTRDPELRSTPNGQQVSSFSVATNFRFKNKNGEQQDIPEYHNIVVWGKLAEICGQYLRKGSQVYIEGRLQTRSWEGKDGVKRYTTEIVASDMIMLGGKNDNGGGGQGAPAPLQPTPTKAASPSPGASAPSDDEISIEDIPF